MQLSQRTDYALRTLLFLATLGEQQLSTLDEIAEKFHIARAHLIKIVGKLAKLHYVITIRGKGGGIKINPTALKAPLYEIVMHFEPTLEIINCDHLACPVQGICRLKLILNEATQAFNDILQRHTLGDMLPKTTEEQFNTRKKLGISITVQS